MLFKNDIPNCYLGIFLQIDIHSTSIRIRLYINDYIHVKQWDVIIHSCPNFNGALVIPSLKLGSGSVITYNKNP